jgi:hypothetical protein
MSLPPQYGHTRRRGRNSPAPCLGGVVVGLDMGTFWFRLALWSAVVLGLAAPAVAAEEAHRFVRIGDEKMFVDDAATKVDGGEVEFSVLYTQYDYGEGGASRPLVGQVIRFRVACDWRAYRTVTTSFYDSQGALTSTRGPETPQMSFYGDKAFHARAIDRVCGWDAPPATQSFGSVKDVLAHVAQTTEPPQPPPVSLPASKTRSDGKIMMAVPAPVRVPTTLADFPDMTAHRFAVVARDAAKGHMLFLDWANMKRDDQGVTALTLAVLADETGVQRGPRWRTPIVAIRAVRYDCTSQTYALSGEMFASFDLQFNLAPTGKHVPRLAATSAPTAAALKAACGSETGPTFASVADAVAHARDAKSGE